MHDNNKSEQCYRLQNRYTHKIFSMDWLSGILKKCIKNFWGLVYGKWGTICG